MLLRAPPRSWPGSDSRPGLSLASGLTSGWCGSPVRASRWGASGSSRASGTCATMGHDGPCRRCLQWKHKQRCCDALPERDRSASAHRLCRGRAVRLPAPRTAASRHRGPRRRYASPARVRRRLRPPALDQQSRLRVSDRAGGEPTPRREALAAATPLPGRPARGSSELCPFRCVDFERSRRLRWRSHHHRERDGMGRSVPARSALRWRPDGYEAVRTDLRAGCAGVSPAMPLGDPHEPAAPLPALRFRPGWLGAELPVRRISPQGLSDARPDARDVHGHGCAGHVLALAHRFLAGGPGNTARLVLPAALRRDVPHQVGRRDDLAGSWVRNPRDHAAPPDLAGRARPSGHTTHLLLKPSPEALVGRIARQRSRRAHQRRAQPIDRFSPRERGDAHSQSQAKTVGGLGGWGRSHVYDEEGRDVTVTDGMWIGTFGANGLLGLSGLLLLLALPAALLVRRYPARTWDSPQLAPAVVLAVVCLLWSVDNLFNAMPNPLYPAACGGIVSFALGRWRVRRRPSTIQAPLPPWQRVTAAPGFAGPPHSR